MDRRRPSKAELKRQAIADLGRARILLAHHTERATAEYSPMAIVERSFRRHRLAWIIGGSAAGLLLARIVFASLGSKNERDKISKSGTNRTLSGLLSGIIASSVRRSAFSYLQKHLQHYLKQHFQPQPAQPGDEH